MALHESAIAVKLWLGIPIFPDFFQATRCMCGHTIDSFGDHLLQFRCHNDLRDIMYHTLLVDDAGSHLELERKKKMLITRRMWKLQADVSTL